MFGSHPLGDKSKEKQTKTVTVTAEDVSKLLDLCDQQSKNLKILIFTILSNREKQQIVTFELLEPADTGYFFFINHFSTRLNDVLIVANSFRLDRLHCGIQS